VRQKLEANEATLKLSHERLHNLCQEMKMTVPAEFMSIGSDASAARMSAYNDQLIKVEAEKVRNHTPWICVERQYADLHRSCVIACRRLVAPLLQLALLLLPS